MTLDAATPTVGTSSREFAGRNSGPGLAEADIGFTASDAPFYVTPAIRDPEVRRLCETHGTDYFVNRILPAAIAGTYPADVGVDLVNAGYTHKAFVSLDRFEAGAVGPMGEAAFAKDPYRFVSKILPNLEDGSLGTGLARMIVESGSHYSLYVFEHQSKFRDLDPVPLALLARETQGDFIFGSMLPFLPDGSLGMRLAIDLARDGNIGFAVLTNHEKFADFPVAKFFGALLNHDSEEAVRALPFLPPGSLSAKHAASILSISDNHEAVLVNHAVFKGIDIDAIARDFMRVNETASPFANVLAAVPEGSLSADIAWKAFSSPFHDRAVFQYHAKFAGFDIGEFAREMIAEGAGAKVATMLHLLSDGTLTAADARIIAQERGSHRDVLLNHSKFSDLDITSTALLMFMNEPMNRLAEVIPHLPDRSLDSGFARMLTRSGSPGLIIDNPTKFHTRPRLG